MAETKREQGAPTTKGRGQGAKNVTNQHIQRRLVGKAGDQGCNERVSSNRCQDIAFVSNVFDLLQLDDLHSSAHALWSGWGRGAHTIYFLQNLQRKHCVAVLRPRVCWTGQPDTRECACRPADQQSAPCRGWSSCAREAPTYLCPASSQAPSRQVGAAAMRIRAVDHQDRAQRAPRGLCPVRAHCHSSR